MSNLILKTPRCDIGGPTGHAALVTLAEAVEQCVWFSAVKSRKEVETLLVGGGAILTNFYTYKALVD